jgi:hypothetical protein
MYLNDSLQHRRFTDELVSLEEKAEVLDQLDIPWLRQPIGCSGTGIPRKCSTARPGQRLLARLRWEPDLSLFWQISEADKIMSSANVRTAGPHFPSCRRGSPCTTLSTNYPSRLMS